MIDDAQPEVRPEDSSTPAPAPARKLGGWMADPSLRGRGPAKGTGGRPRDEWKAFIRSLVDSEETRGAIAAILTNPKHPAFAQVLRWADERGWGKEPQGIEGSHRLEVVHRDETRGRDPHASGAMQALARPSRPDAIADVSPDVQGLPGVGDGNGTDPDRSETGEETDAHPEAAR